MTELKILILGAGFSSKGHTVAFRGAGTQIVVGRRDHVVRDVAQDLAIP